MPGLFPVLSAVLFDRKLKVQQVVAAFAGDKTIIPLKQVAFVTRNASKERDK
jgi:hypothetical protein